MATKILANDGIDSDTLMLLEEAGYIVNNQKVNQEHLADEIKKYDVIIVRSATKVDKSIIDKAIKLKVIARAGVGLDNIDTDYAKEKGIKVINTPKASSLSVAELTMAHIHTLARNLHKSNRQMHNQGYDNFKQLKKNYSSNSHELSGKTIGVIGVGNIGKGVTKLALALGMRVLPNDNDDTSIRLNFQFLTEETIGVFLEVPTVNKEILLRESDFITIHAPWSGGAPIIGEKEIALMKHGVYIINLARGGAVCEKALLEGLNSGKIAGAALDVFENEPHPKTELLEHPNVSLSPHIGGSTFEAQKRIGLELADQILDFFGDN